MISDSDARPLLGETSRDGGADARRAAGDEDGFAGKIWNYETGSGHQDAFLAKVRSQGFGWPSRNESTADPDWMALEPARRNFDANHPNAPAPGRANPG
jgi:hypothetical protein